MKAGKKLLWLGCHGAAALAILLLLILGAGSRRDSDREEREVNPGLAALKGAGLEDRVIDWGDEELERAMREKTGIWDRDIQLSDVWEMSELQLAAYSISDISALSGLTNLEELWLDRNQISDISALSVLMNLSYVSLNGNPVSTTDIKVLETVLGKQCFIAY